MGKRKSNWFKHYSDASSGTTLRALWDSKDFQAYSFWWMLHELICRWSKPEEPGQITVSWATLARETGWSCSKVRSKCAQIALNSEIELKPISDDLVTIIQHNWLEYNTSWGGKRDASKTQDVGRIKNIRIKNYRSNTAHSSALEQQHPLLELWNKHRGGGMPECKGLSSSRKRLADARWKEKPETEYWGEIVTRMARSKFCRGECPPREGSDKPFRASFDFLVKPDTQHKVLEGAYDDHKPPGPKGGGLINLDEEEKRQMERWQK